MFIAASTHCFPELSPREACVRIDDLEYSKYELWLSDEFEATNPQARLADVEHLAADLLEATRLTPIAISVESEISEADFRKLVKLARTLRVAQVTIPASPLGTPFNTEIDRLRSFVGLGSEGGMRVSIKTRTGDLTEDPHTAVELCDAVKGLGLTLDPSHYVFGNAAPSFDQVFRHVYHVQLRDTKPDALQVPAGLGEIDFSRLIAQLRRENYNGALSIDLLPGEFDDETRTLELRKLRMLLETLL